MDINGRIHCLKNIDLFDFMSDSEQRAFAEKLPEIKLDPGDILFREGDPGEEMFVLLSGILKVHKGLRMITEIEAVDYIGEMSLIEDKPRSATVMAVEPSELLSIDREVFQSQLTGRASSLVSIMKSLSRKIRNDTEIIAGEFTKANILIHDMKNQLTSLMFLDLFLKNTPEGPKKEYILRMIDVRQNLDDMMNEAMANAKRLQLPYNKQQASLAALITDLVENELAHHPVLADKTITLDMQQVPDFSFNQLDIRRVITNLLLNAGQAGRPGDTIEVSVNIQGNCAVIQCKDRGCGIYPDLLDRIFEPHFTTREDGNGLGLSSCKQIIEEKHGGTLTCSSTPGEATVFSCSLPLN